jgi:hypothetical protein
VNKYRLYIDEVGNPDLDASEDTNHRYLWLTGVILELEYVRNTVAPRLEQIKGKYFHAHPDEPIVFHRKELVNHRRPFEALRSPETEKQFNQEILQLFRELEYTVISVVIDKLEHRNRYQTWQYDPYHYCLAVLIERYTMWLDRHQVLGDVMSESRGGKEDMRLKKSFRRLIEEGSQYKSASSFQARLTSKELKVKTKANNIAGLQLADLFAHPLYRRMLEQRCGERGPGPFGTFVVEILEQSKLDRSATGRIDGYGLKWLP